MRLGVTPKGKETKVVVIAASVSGPADAEKTYQHLLASYADAMRESADYYRAYLEKTVSLELPDAALQQAYDWARISTMQGVVNNLTSVRGWLPGYRTSGVGQRPGFAWFFGRDSLWTSFALNAEGDYSTTANGARFHQQVSAGRREGSARNFAEREPGSVVQGLSLPLGFRRCNAAVHHRDE